MAGEDDFSAFYRAGYGRLVGQLLAITGNLQDAEDAVQEAFARASLRWTRLRDFDLPEAWVRRVAINLAASGVRRARRQLAVLARVVPPAPLPARSPEQLALAAALGRLPLRYRQVLVLHYGADLSVEETARQLGVPTGTVKSRLARGRVALQRQLTDHGEEAAHAHR
jgi:RNA polymerase sigma-70 factor (ECF subfamily)